MREEKEQNEYLEEVFQVQKYKDDIFYKRGNPTDIQNFINKVVEKYSSKPEVQNFYTPSNNNVYMSQYDTLCCIEKMLFQYASVKGVEASNKK